MPCIHGLDENNCPICRIVRSNTPDSPLKMNNLHLNYLKPQNPAFKKNAKEKEELIKELMPQKLQLNPNLINPILKPTLINDLPNFKNKIFSKRLKELDVSKSDTFGISKNRKIPLLNPELKFDKEE